MRPVDVIHLPEMEVPADGEGLLTEANVALTL
jgi:hypothetical protein